jgi:hypothetical protein
MTLLSGGSVSISITADQSIVVVVAEPEAKTGDSSGEGITRVAEPVSDESRREYGIFVHLRERSLP